MGLRILSQVFWNPFQNRMRAGWRILAYDSSFLIIAATANFIMKSLIPAPIIRSLTGFLVIPVISGGTLWLAGRCLDHRKFKDYGFHLSRRWGGDFLFGFVLGAFLLLMIFLIEKAMGWIVIIDFFQNSKEGYRGLPFAIPLMMGFIAFVLVGFYEEILFRAYLITNLSEGFNPSSGPDKKALMGGYILSSLVFGLSHSINPHATLIGVINIMLGGLFFGLPYVLTGELAISWALHISWNFFQGNLFGFPASGLSQNISVFAIAQHGPQIWTGGAFGPEGGLIGTFAILTGCGLVLLWLRILRRPLSLFSKLAEYHAPTQRRDGGRA